ncbi:MAG: 16S rRNA (guanine(527)-N(7))-methyltransferase RsmG [Clostridia bacterium]|nr:16S rRNA (guanine(527)-N(7))-methyltransferase RsmG [Clostridia bacterium]
MIKEDFFEKMRNLANNINIQITDSQIEKFYIYMYRILEWNKKINLTAIEDENEIILKHFIDSLTIQKYIEGCKNMIDIGTGAGFPGIPIAIMNDKINITLLDSLNKRINFLNDIIQELKLNNVVAIHGRAEDIAKLNTFREKYDVVTSRAVAQLNILLEYMLPFNKLNGKTISMKGSNIEEIKDATNALNELGGKIQVVENIVLPNTNIQRNIIIVEKIKETSKKYPRKAGVPKKEPL